MYTSRQYRGLVCYVQSGSPPGHAAINSLSGTDRSSADWFLNCLVGYLESQLRCLLVPTIPQFASSEPLRLCVFA